MNGTDKQIPEVSDKIFTVPNLISFIRLCLIPVFFILLLNGRDIASAILFGFAASTDWVDGQVARRTNAVSKLGQTLDPVVDRLLMLSGVIGVFLVGRMPFWIIVLVLLRDVFLLAGGAILLKKCKDRPQVIYAGKVATTFLFFGFFGQLLNYPVFNGLGIVNVSWLPGLNSALTTWGIYFVYIGLIIGLFTTIYYTYAGWKIFKNHSESNRNEGTDAK